MTSDQDKIIKKVAKDVEARLRVGVHIARGPNWSEEYGDYVFSMTQYKASVPRRFLQGRYWVWFLAGYGFSRFVNELIVWLT